jgi:hypothetical protein
LCEHPLSIPMDIPVIALPLKRFMVVEQCPPEWRRLDLYVFRDETVAFYVGQSYVAFDRVWEHLRNGFRGRSVIGRFILCNWPASLRFTIELLSSASSRFEAVGYDLDAAERDLIRQWAPCFNVSLNSQPTPVPACYRPPDAKPLCSRSLNKLIHEAERANRTEDSRLWLGDEG